MRHPAFHMSAKLVRSVSSVTGFLRQCEAMRSAGKTPKRRKKGLNSTSISGINTRIMRATPLLAAMNTYKQQTT